MAKDRAAPTCPVASFLYSPFTANEHPTTLDKNSVCYWSSTGCFVSHLNLTGRNVQEDVLSKFNVLSKPDEHTWPEVLGKSQNIQAGNCKRVKCDTWIKREVVPSVPKTFLPWWYRVSGTPLPPQTEHCSFYKASPCQALLSGNPSSDHLWMMHSSAFPFTHSFAQTCTHPEENCFHHSHFCTLEYYWAAFWMISFMLWPWPSVRNPAQCSLQKHGVMVENKQDGTARGLALTFQWPPIPLRLSLAPLSACFSLSPFGVHWSQVWSHWDVEMCI